MENCLKDKTVRDITPGGRAGTRDLYHLIAFSAVSSKTHDTRAHATHVASGETIVLGNRVEQLDPRELLVLEVVARQQLFLLGECQQLMPRNKLCKTRQTVDADEV
jgi:hypothetical protein